jgi:hypothetical protein
MVMIVEMRGVEPRSENKTIKTPTFIVYVSRRSGFSVVQPRKLSGTKPTLDVFLPIGSS